MTRNKKASAAHRAALAAAKQEDQQQPNNKRPRTDAAGPSGVNYNANLLANNSFAALPVQSTPAQPVQPVPRKVKVPPLFTTSKEIAKLRDDFALMQITPLFKLCSMGTKIVCSNEADFKQVKDYLNVESHEYYTHDTPGSKPLKVVIRGLPQYTPEEVLEELKLAKLKPVKVFPIGRKDNGNYRDQLYLAHLEKGSTTLEELRKIRALFNVIVEWERYRPKKRDVTQCSNCLSFGHGTKNCYMKARCGTCAGAHETSRCDQMDEGAQPKCVNCNAEHVGNDRACPKRAEYIEIRKKASTRNQRGRPRRQPPPVTEELFPPIRYIVPNLPPLQPHRHENRNPAGSVNYRMVAAAAAPPVQAAAPPVQTVPPPRGNQQPSTSSFQASGDDPFIPYTPDQMMEFIGTLNQALLRCRSRTDQLQAATVVLMNFVIKHGP